MNEILIGAISALCFAIAMFFLRFWKTTQDRFFLFFAISFLIEGFNRLLLSSFFDLHEISPLYYLFRVVSYLFIVVAILSKNREHKG